MPKRMSYRYKLYGLIAAFFVVVLIFFGLVYGWMNSGNRVLAEQIAAKNQAYAEAVAEQKSYDLGKKDVQALTEKSLQPNDLFSQDTKVVKEITTLEALSRSFGLKFTLQVAGTIKSASKVADTTSQIFLVPYTMVVEGPFDKLVNFVESTEHVPFVTHLTGLSLSGLASGQVHALLNAEFYIKP